MSYHIRLVKGDHDLKEDKSSKLVTVSAKMKTEVVLAMAKIMNKEKSSPNEILQAFIDKTFGK